MTHFFSLLLKPFEEGNAHGGLIFISVLTGIVMLFLYKFTSNQTALKIIKSRISAYFLEMRLYKDDFSIVSSSLKNIFATNLQYMKLALLPAIIMILPVILIMIQLNLRYAHTGLEQGSSALLRVRFEEGIDILRKNIDLRVGDGLSKDSAAFRIPPLKEVGWRIGVVESGIHMAIVSVDGKEIAIPIVATKKIVPCYTDFERGGIRAAIFNPGAPRVPTGIGVVSIKVEYPKRTFSWGLFRFSWLWSFLIISMASGLIIKSALKIE